MLLIVSYFSLAIQDADLRQVMPFADLEIIEVVRRRDLHRARTLLRVGILIGDDRNRPAHQRQDHVLAHQFLVALVVGMDGNRGIAKHRLGPGGGDHQEGRRILRIEGPVGQRIAQLPELAIDLLLFDLEVGDRRQQLGIPVDQPLVLVDQSVLIESDEHLDDRDRKSVV